MTYHVSADTGGTFIDVVIQDAHGNLTIGKSLTTHDRVFVGLSAALENAASDLGLTARQVLDDTDIFIYGTTRATNAIVTRNAAKTAFLTTEGFPDILVIKEGGKLDGYDFTTSFPEPYIPRSLTFEVAERIDAEGSVVQPLDEEALRATLHEIKARGVEAIAVSYLWSVSNPVHELRTGEIIAEVLPGVPFTLAHQIAPVLREYRRASAASIDASLKPLMQDHFKQLESDLRGFGYDGQVLVSTSIGGVMTIDEVIQSPIHTAKSGPAMAPLAGVTFSELEGLGGNMIVCDTGGTTFDVGISRDGELVYSRDTWMGDMWEGDLLGISSVDIRSIGAGGGSIAWVDEGGLLRVGPQSAGSEPGPACYGAGGTQATLSDAACVLGYFDPAYFLGGRMTLDVDAAERAIGDVAEKLGKGLAETAWGILTVASESMVKAVNEITVSQGMNPQESTLVAGGGAAGINIMQIARELGSTQMVLPKVASALSASGMHFADIVKEEYGALVTSTSAFDAVRVNALLDRLDRKLLDFEQRLDGSTLGYEIEYVVESRYQAQVWSLDVTLPVSRFASDEDVMRFLTAFHDVHDRVLGIRDESSPVECLNWKARLTVKLPHKHRAFDAIESHERTSATSRACYFGGAGYETTPIYRPDSLDLGARVQGPAIIEEPTTTLVVFPGMSAEVSGSGNYILHI